MEINNWRVLNSSLYKYKNGNVNVIEVKDKYNIDKVWIIREYFAKGCIKYTINQKICGKMFYKTFKYSSKREIKFIFGEDIAKKIFSE